MPSSPECIFCLIIVVPTIANLDDNEYEDN